MNTKRRMIAILTLFVIILTCLRIVWIDQQRPLEQPLAVNGVLDLRDWELPEDRTIMLNGEWAFYPSVFVFPGLSEEISHATEVTTTIDNQELTDVRQSISVPALWDEVFEDQSTYRYGTYHLTILTDPEQDTDHYGLRIRTIRYASSIYANGQLVSSEGATAERESDFIPHILPQSATVHPVDGRIELSIHVSSNTAKAGIIYPIRFGTEEAVEQRVNFSMAVQLLTATVLLIHALYALILTWMTKGNRLLVYFSFMMGCAILTVLISDDKLLYSLFQLDYETEIKIFLLAYTGFSATVPLFLNKLFAGYANQKVMRWFTWYVIVYIIFVVVVPARISYPTASILLSVTMISTAFLSIHIMFRAWRQREDVFFVLLGCAALSLNIVWSISFSRMYYDQIHYPLDLIIAVGCFATFWFKRFFQANHDALQLAEKLQEQNKQKDEFLANTSHELRNPLHGMINMTQTILEDPRHSLVKPHREKMELMIAVGRRMTHMLDDLLDATRLKDKMIQLHPGDTSLQSVANGVVEMLDFMVDTRHISFRLDIPDDFPTVWADENRLIQIMYNLLHNAVKYTEHGEIVVRAQVTGKNATIEVEDTGIGMDEQTLERIFLPYEQGDTNKQQASGGFGLGLSICRQLVDMHGSTLTVRSKPGKGSCFTFTLPTSQSKQDVPSEPNREVAAVSDSSMSAQSDAMAMPMSKFTSKSMSKSMSKSTSKSMLHDLPREQDKDILADNSQHLAVDQGHGSDMATGERRKVLIIDDDLVNLRLLAEILGNTLYDIHTASAGAEALALLEDHRFDLIISDVMMPYLSGYELTRIVRERFSQYELPVLLLTARSRAEDIFAGFQSGANDYVTKPVDAMELRARVYALTELKHSIDQRLRFEGAWLQAQIRPHFLYNTLNSIAALATIDISKMRTLLEHFGHYLRISFDFHNLDHVVTLDRELDLVRSYLFIEKQRFGDRLEVKWEVSADLQTRVPPLSIQTLVENALNHGILKRATGGLVEIRIFTEREYTEVMVIDNGVGMSEEMVQSVKDGVLHRKAGVGMYNTDRRLKQIYDSGLNIESSIDEGTIVSFRIPRPREARY